MDQVDGIPCNYRIGGDLSRSVFRDKRRATLGPPRQDEPTPTGLRPGAASAAATPLAEIFKGQII